MLCSIPILIKIKNIKFRNIHRKTLGLESLFNFITKRLRHRYFPVNIAKFLRTPILKNSCERLLLCSSTFCTLQLSVPM